MMLVRQRGRLNTNSGGPCCTTCGLLDILVLHRTHSHPPTTTSEQSVIRQSEDISTYSCMDEISLSIHHTHKYVRLSIHPTFKKKMSAFITQKCPPQHSPYIYKTVPRFIAHTKMSSILLTHTNCSSHSISIHCTHTQMSFSAQPHTLHIKKKNHHERKISHGYKW